MKAFGLYDETKAHEIAKGIYWVGFADRKAGFSNNPYIFDDGNSATEKLIES